MSIIDINNMMGLADDMASAAVVFGTTSQGYDLFLSARERFKTELQKIKQIDDTLGKVRSLVGDDIY